MATKENAEVFVGILDEGFFTVELGAPDTARDVTGITEITAKNNVCSTMYAMINHQVCIIIIIMLSLTSVSASEIVIGDVAEKFELPCQRVHAVTVTVCRLSDSNRR